jgi:ribonuclease BN (tRNA processing enzyme)
MTMKITLLGTGTSYPDPDRVQSGILIESGDDRILLDIGSGILHRLTQLELDLREINSVFISHFHVDHSSDFLPLYQSLWLTKSASPLKVYGPSSIYEWLRGIQDIAFPYLRSKLEIQVSKLNQKEDVEIGDIVISNISTIHGTIDSRAFRVKAEGTDVVYSSDTAPSRKFNKFAKNADILIHECNWLDGQHPEGVHTSPSEMAEIVEETIPRKVVLTHLSPEVVRNGGRVLDIVKSRYDADVYLGQDLQSFQI